MSIIKKWWQRRMEKWISKKVPRVMEWTTTNRRIYILPTKYGYYYLSLTMILLLFSINYGNSMAFSLTFLLMAIGFVTLYKTHANILHLKFTDSKNQQTIFANDMAKFTVNVKNLSKRKKYCIQPNWNKAEKNKNFERQFDIDGLAEKQMDLFLPTKKRGYFKAPRFLISSVFPLGIGGAWSWMELDMQCLVYPQPLSLKHAINKMSESEDGPTVEKIGSEEFAHLRNYRVGDPMKLIHWKSFTTGRTPMVKEFIEIVGGEIWLDWNKLPDNLNFEEKISFLTQLVIEMEDENYHYGLRLPHEELKPSHGHFHYHECLKKLALYT